MGFPMARTALAAQKLQELDNKYGILLPLTKK
jgi:hypothetical protein